MQSSTALTEQLGNAGAQEVRRAHNDIVRAALSANSGSEIKHTGDGVTASFPTASSALDCAIAIQRAVEQHQTEPVKGHAGDVVREVASDGRANVHGGAVQVASRVQSVAAPGEVLVSATVRDLARTSAGVEFEDRGAPAPTARP